MIATALRQHPAGLVAGGVVVTLPCLAIVVAVLLHYPLSARFLAISLMLYAAVLWRWPGAWLLVIPAVIPGYDLGVWTGWSFVHESDLFILVTVGLLAVRDPPDIRELLPHGPARAIIVFVVVATLIAVVIGLKSPHGFKDPTDLAYLRPEGAVRAAKGLVIALLLLPFLRRRHRVQGDAMTLFAAGMLAGLALVAVETFAERWVFPGAFNISSRYPAAALFSGMNVGGGHLGVYVAMALPFALLRRSRQRRIERMALRALDLAATYVVIITFSIIIYGAAAISVALTFLGRTAPRNESGLGRRGERRPIFRYALRASYIVVLILLAIVALIGGSVFEKGAQKVVDNFIYREHSVVRRLRLRDFDLGTDLFGMGFGSFPRVVTARADDGRSNFAVEHDDDVSYLSLMTGPAFFFGQKVPVVPGSPYTVTLTYKSPGRDAPLSVLLCEKYLLHSQNCVAQVFTPAMPGKWETVTAVFATAGMDPNAHFGPLRRPIELSLHDGGRNVPIAIRSVGLTGPDGRELVVNGAFAHGADRWYFSDENHDYWQIMNQYFMILFEGGVLGFVAFLTLVGAALVGARRAMRRSDRVGTAVVASLGTFLVLCLFESPLQSPHVSVLFNLTCMVGLLMLEYGTSREYLAQMRRPWTERGFAGGAAQPRTARSPDQPGTLISQRP